MKEKLENFERAFSSGGAGCVRTCECGKTFYDQLQQYDWEDGELESLSADKEAIGLPYAVSTIFLEGREYVMDCECWKGRAEKVIGFIEGHGHSIAAYFKLEKERLAAIAAMSPEIDPP